LIRAVGGVLAAMIAERANTVGIRRVRERRLELVRRLNRWERRTALYSTLRSPPPTGAKNYASAAQMCGLEDLDQIWRMIELGGGGSGPDDAEHWMRVYRELVGAAEAMLAAVIASESSEQNEQARHSLDRRVAALRARLGYWEEQLRKSGREP
jgi:hypothetical protein